ncbi:MAG: putative peptidoglycan glycosyltransferase FtsW [Hyphomicrobiaceae bacterium]
MRLSRTDRSVLARWWFSVDRSLLAAVLLLILAGAVLSLAAGPAVALKRGLPQYFFVERHAVFALLATGLLLLVSQFDPRAIRRLALGLFVVSLALMAVAIRFGPEINGAHRWVHVAGYSLQPSEFAKPGFVVLSAWLLSEGQRQRDIPATAVACALLAAMVGLLALQPDIGQALLVSSVWIAMLYVAGQRLRWVLAMFGVAAVGLAGAYVFLGHVRGRIDRFLSPGSGDTYQTERARQSFMEGGLFGRGPGEGTIKSQLPDSHTDFVFAVIAEEYGIIVCLGVLLLFAFVVYRALRHALNEGQAFVSLATTGLALVFGLQALINMAVNVGLLPAKGMTLPFISYGGSSLLSLGMTLGMLIALTRRRPEAIRPKMPKFMGTLANIQPTGGARK